MDAARAEYESGASFLLLDLQSLEMLTSAGLRAFHKAFMLFTPKEEIDAWEKEKHGKPYKSPYFKLAGASLQIYYTLNLAGFLHNIPIFAKLQDGLDSFHS